MSTHPSNDQLIGYIHQTLTDAEREEIDQHLTKCAQCRSHLDGLESLQRRIQYGLANDLRQAPASLHKSFATIAPRLKRGRRWAIVRTTTERLVVVAALVTIFVLGYGLLTQTLPGDGPPVDGSDSSVALFRGDSSRTGVYDSRPVPGLGEVAWTFTTTLPIFTSPAFDDGKIYIANVDGYIYALDSQTGEQKWKVSTGLQAFSSPVAHNGKLYVASGNQIYALNTQLGQEKWKVNLYWADSTPTVTDEMLYVGTNVGYLCALDIHTGEKIWQYPAQGSIVSSPVVVNGTVYFGSKDAHIYALNARTGQEVWQIKTGGAVDASPAVADGVLYVGSSDGYLYALDSKTGRKRWRFHAKGKIFASPTVADGQVYFGDLSGHFYALNSRTGQEVWRVTMSKKVESSAAVANGVVYVGGSDPFLHVLDAQTGQTLWTFKTKSTIKSSPIVAGGMVYFGGMDGIFYAVK
jgi:outer membrane protein assembly factor BamB